MSSIKVSTDVSAAAETRWLCRFFGVLLTCHAMQGGTALGTRAFLTMWYENNIHVDLLKGCFTMVVVSVGDCLSNIIWAILLKFVAGRVAEVLSVRKL